MIVHIDPRGRLTLVYLDRLAELLEHGLATVRRASHVEPGPAGGWTVDLSPSQGPVLGPYRLRAQALAVEAGWLEARLAAGWTAESPDLCFNCREPLSDHELDQQWLECERCRCA